MCGSNSFEKARQKYSPLQPQVPVPTRRRSSQWIPAKRRLVKRRCPTRTRRRSSSRRRLNAQRERHQNHQLVPISPAWSSLVCGGRSVGRGVDTGRPSSTVVMPPGRYGSLGVLGGMPVRASAPPGVDSSVRADAAGWGARASRRVGALVVVCVRVSWADGAQCVACVVCCAPCGVVGARAGGECEAAAGWGARGIAARRGACGCACCCALCGPVGA